MYCNLLKDDSLLRILRLPGYFETALFRTFFHFPWDFEIVGFDCSEKNLLKIPPFHGDTFMKTQGQKRHFSLLRDKVPVQVQVLLS